MHFRCAIMALAENGPLVKRLRHRPLTAKTWVRFPYGSPKKQIPHPRYLLLSFGGPYGIQNPSPSRRLGRVRIPRAEQRPLASRWQAWVYSPKAKFPSNCNTPSGVLFFFLWWPVRNPEPIRKISFCVGFASAPQSDRPCSHEAAARRKILSGIAAQIPVYLRRQAVFSVPLRS